MADAWSSWGDLGDAGQLDEAERCLSRALTWSQTAGRSITLPLLHSGRLLAGAGAGCRGRVEEALDRALRRGERLWVAPCKAALVQVAAGLDDWMVFDIGLDELSREPWVGVTQLHELVGPLEEAGRLAAERGHLGGPRRPGCSKPARGRCARDEGAGPSLRRRASGQEDARPGGPALERARRLNPED